MNSPNDNTDSLPSEMPTKNKGSAVAGFFLGWLVMLSVSSIAFAIFGNDHGLGDAAMFTIPIALSTMLGCIIWFLKTGKSKTAKGIMLSFVSLIALGLLLLAACYGIVSMM